MEIIGHRGARGEAPENTLTGFRYLAQLGIPRVEFDIQVAGDGQLIVIHDATLNRTTHTQGSIKEHNSHSLAQVDACHHRQYPHANGDLYDWPVCEGVPTLAQVLTLIADFEHLQLEVKAQSVEDCQQVVTQLPALWQPFGSRAVTTSFNTAYLAMIRAAAPHIPRGLLVESYFTGDMVALALELGCVSIGPHQQLCTPELIQQAHDAGLKVSTWTVNDPQRMLELQAMGVDSIITDVPSLALKVIG